MYAVVIELDGRAPELVSEHVKVDDAMKVAEAVARENQHTGGKVTISQPESTDQLQRYSRGRFLRQEPEKVATGQDLTVLVPRLTVDKEDYDRWRR
jgi:hypothetical protein